MSFISDIIVLFAVFNVAFGQISNDLDFDDLKKNLENPDLEGLQKKLAESGVTLPPDFNQTGIDFEKVENAFRKKCEERNAGDAVDDLKNQQTQIQQCLGQQMNGSAIQEELEEAKKTGSMDEVFKKYCDKWPAVYGCFDSVFATARKCMTENENKNFNKTLIVVGQFEEFMCFKDGDRLAMFVAEGGVECIQEQQEGIKQCVNATLEDQIPQGEEEISLVLTGLLAGEHCSDFDEIRSCVSSTLEKCKDSTPANIVDAAFKFIRKQMTCRDPVGELSTPVPSEVKSSTSSGVTKYLSLSVLVVSLSLFSFV